MYDNSELENWCKEVIHKLKKHRNFEMAVSCSFRMREHEIHEGTVKSTEEELLLGNFYDQLSWFTVMWEIDIAFEDGKTPAEFARKISKPWNYYDPFDPKENPFELKS